MHTTRSVSYRATAGNAQVWKKENTRHLGRKSRPLIVFLFHFSSSSFSFGVALGISLSTNGCHIASVGKDSKICVTDVRMRKQLCSIADDEFKIERVKWTRCCFSPGLDAISDDGRSLLETLVSIS